MKKILMISHSSCGGGAETIFLKVIDILKNENNISATRFVMKSYDMLKVA